VRYEASHAESQLLYLLPRSCRVINAVKVKNAQATWYGILYNPASIGKRSMKHETGQLALYVTLLLVVRLSSHIVTDPLYLRTVDESFKIFPPTIERTGRYTIAI
jgi:hypothetical protein